MFEVEDKRLPKAALKIPFRFLLPKPALKIPFPFLFSKPALKIPFPVNKFPNKLAPKVPYNILKNPPYCSFASFFIVLLAPFSKTLEFSKA